MTTQEFAKELRDVHHQLQSKVGDLHAICRFEQLIKMLENGDIDISIKIEESN